MYKIYLEIFRPILKYSQQYVWPDQSLSRGQVRLRSFIAQSPVETDFALRPTEVASTVIHVSSVVNSRNSFLSMGPNKWGWKEDNQAGQNQVKLTGFTT